VAKYLLAYHGGKMPETDAERAQVMQAWEKWMGQLGAGLVDGGNPTGPSATIASSGVVSHGGGANPVSGYSFIAADNLDAAVALAKGCPILLGGGSIEVAEVINVM
jgi:hypothetical protein